MPPNFYQTLGVQSGADEAGLKIAFRAFARKWHPDKMGGGRGAGGEGGKRWSGMWRRGEEVWGVGVGGGGEEVFREVREVYDALRNPVIRFAYDRFVFLHPSLYSHSPYT